MPDYLCQDGSYGAINVRSKLSESIEISNDTHTDEYQIILTQWGFKRICGIKSQCMSK